MRRPFEPFKLGGPFSSGYVSAFDREDCPLDAMTAESYDFDVDPADGSLVRRLGGRIIGDTVGANDIIEVAGLLPFKASMRSRKIAGIKSDSQTNGAPVTAILYTVEDMAADTDSGRFGTLWYYLNGVGHTLLDDWSPAHYHHADTGYAGGAMFNVPMHMIVVPLWYDSGEGGYTRGSHAFARRFLACGSRGFYDGGEYLFLPNYLGTPAEWSKTTNPDISSGIQKVRLRPSGLWPPLQAARLTLGAEVAEPKDGKLFWRSGDFFYTGYAFRDRYGAWGPLFIPEAVNGIGDCDNLGGAFLVGTLGEGKSYEEITLSYLPYRPHGYTAIGIFRSPVIHLESETDPITVFPRDLKLWKIIENSEQSSVTMKADTKRDEATVEPGSMYRTDHISPPRSRYYGVFEQRLAGLCAQPSTNAIIVAPSGAVPLAYPDDSEDLIWATNAWFVRITATEFQLSRYHTAGFAWYTDAFTLANKTLGDLVRWINNLNRDVPNTTTSQRWCAQLAPGAGEDDPAEWLLPTYRQVTVTGTNGQDYVTVSATDYGYVAVGARIGDLVGIPANTLVREKRIVSGAYRLYLGNLSGVAVNLTAGIAAQPANVWFDTGTEATSLYAVVTIGGLATEIARGQVEALRPTVPFFAYYRKQYREWAPHRQEMYFTASSPSEVQLANALAPRLWVARNKRQFPASNGILTGLGAVDRGAMVIMSQGRAYLANIKNVRSGEDDDFQWTMVNTRRGAPCWSAIAEGDGWVAMVNEDGIEVADAEGSVWISPAIHRGGAHVRGSLAYELARSVAAAALDNDGGRMFLAVLGGSSLHLSLDVAANTRRRMKYDFSDSVAAHGRREVLDERGLPFPWSSPFTQSFYAMAESRDADGAMYLATQDTNAGATGDGRLNEFDSGVYDYHSEIGKIGAKAYLATSCSDNLEARSPQRAIWKGNRPVLAGNLKFTFYRDHARSVAFSIIPGLNATAELIDEIPLPVALRTPGRYFECIVEQVAVLTDASLQNPLRFSGMVIGGSEAPLPP